MIISHIAAMSRNRVIGKNNALPWRLPADMKFFKETTQGHVVIMGRKNYEAEGKPLKNRTNIVISRQKNYIAEGCLVVQSINEALEEAGKVENEEIFIIGGGEIYRQSIGLTDKIYLTVIHAEIEGDVFYPEFEGPGWALESERFYAKDEKNIFDHTYLVYSRK